MGYLDHSTNNIIVDAVLTDYGREQLAQLGGNGTGNLVKHYAFADTEVDYSMITKYGTIVGKEKIEKNTPIFEAQTSADNGIHTLLITTENPAGILANTETSVTNTTVGSGTSPTTTVINIQTADPDNQTTSIAYSVVYNKRYLIPQTPIPGPLVDKGENLKVIEIGASSNTSVSVTFRVNEAGRERLIEETNSEKGETIVYIRNQTTGQNTEQTINLDYTKQ